MKIITFIFLCFLLSGCADTDIERNYAIVTAIVKNMPIAMKAGDVEKHNDGTIVKQILRVGTPYRELLYDIEFDGKVGKIYASNYSAVVVFKIRVLRPRGGGRWFPELEIGETLIFKNISYQVLGVIKDYSIC